MDSSSKKRLILAITCLAQFMVVLDVAIVNVALPAIQKDLGLGQSALQWVVIAYSLMLGGFLLLGGRLGDLLGRRRILLSGMTLFASASLLAGIAQSAELLIGARAVQGFGAALMAPSALSILAVTFTEGRERNWALGIFGAVGGTSASVGVIASGLLTDGPGWRWIFFINVPIGIALIALSARVLSSDQGEAAGRRHFDALGATTVTAGLLLLVYALNRGVDNGWGSATTLALFAAAAVLLAAFVRVESRSRSPLIPGASLRNRTMVAANISAFLLFGAFFSFIFLGSLLMQQLLGYSPTRAGVGWLATSVVAFLAAAVTGARLVTVFGVQRLLVAGLFLMAVGMIWLTRIPIGANYPTDVLPAFVLAGLAIGFCAPTVQIAALSGVVGSSAGLASGLVETMREIGGAVGIAAVSTVLVARSADSAQTADPALQQAAAFDSFQSAFLVILAFAAVGAIAAAIGFARPRARVRVRQIETVPASADGNKPIGYWLKQADRAYAKQFESVFSSEGLTRLHWQLLNFVNEEDTATKSEVHDAMRRIADTSALDSAIRDLVGRGWLGRLRVGRESAYVLTEDGLEGRRSILRSAGLVGKQAVNGIGLRKHRVAIKTLERIVQNLDGDSKAS